MIDERPVVEPLGFLREKHRPNTSETPSRQCQSEIERLCEMLVRDMKEKNKSKIKLPIDLNKAVEETEKKGEWDF